MGRMPAEGFRYHGLDSVSPFDTGVMRGATRSVIPSSARAARPQDRGLRPDNAGCRALSIPGGSCKFLFWWGRSLPPIVEVCRLRPRSQTEGEADLTAIRWGHAEVIHHQCR